MSNEHGLAPTPEITAADNPGTQQPVPAKPGAAPAVPGTEPTLPIGGADGAQAALYKPTGIADHLLGQDDKGTIDKLLTAYTGARTELAKGAPQIPAAADYKIEWSDTVKSMDIKPDDPAMAVFRDLASEFKLTQEQIGFVPKFVDQLIEKGLIEKPFDSGAMLASLAPDEFRGTDIEKQARGGQRLTAAENWINQLAPAHGVDDQIKQELRLLTTSKDGVRAVEWLMKAGTNLSVSTGGQGGQQVGITKQALDARTADPRNDLTKHTGDPAFAEETRRMFREFYKE